MFSRDLEVIIVISTMTNNNLLSLKRPFHTLPRSKKENLIYLKKKLKKIVIKKKIVKDQSNWQTSQNILSLYPKIFFSAKTQQVEGHLRNAKALFSFIFFLKLKKILTKYPPLDSTNNERWRVRNGSLTKVQKRKKAEWLGLI